MTPIQNAAQGLQEVKNTFAFRANSKWRPRRTTHHWGVVCPVAGCFLHLF